MCLNTSLYIGLQDARISNNHVSWFFFSIYPISSNPVLRSSADIQQLSLTSHLCKIYYGTDLQKVFNAQIQYFKIETKY